MSRKRPHRGNRRHGNHPKPHKTKTLLQGTMQIMRPGLAHVQTAEGTFAVARRGVREAMNGDEVQVSLVPMHGRRGEPVAYVQAVLQRACASVLGTYTFSDPLGVVTPLDGRITHDFFVVPEDTSARSHHVNDGDVVVARIVEYPTRQSAGVVTIERRLGSSTELDVNVEAIIASYGLPVDFSPSVLREASAVRADAVAALESDKLRRDMRDEVCVTIDPADARDFDDAVGAQRLEDGYRVFVHIADVTHYLPWDSSMDVEARQRTCSVYLVDRVIPMLPEQLCNDVCSLRPQKDRLTMTVRMDLDERGNIRDAEVFPSVIRSRARLSYDVADELLEGARNERQLPCDECDQVPVSEGLRMLDKIAQLRQGIRERRGALDFETVEAKVLLDEDGRPYDMVVRRRTRATSLVEEAMLMANESVARMLAEHDRATAYRVHERPSPEDLRACLPALQELGLVQQGVAERLTAADPYAIQDVLRKAQGGTGAPLANTLLLRAQKRAVYVPHNEGHYALGAKAYCHFTSPIRRYPDVLVHRALKQLLYNRPASKKIEDSLAQLCRTCSDRERAADAASKASQRVKMAELYGERIGQSYAGVVVGCERFGLFVMLDDTCAEGLLPTRALGEEWFYYDEARMRLVGESTGRRWHVGQRVAVTVAEVDVPKGRIDFVLARRALSEP